MILAWASPFNNLGPYTKMTHLWNKIFLSQKINNFQKKWKRVGPKSVVTFA